MTESDLFERLAAKRKLPLANERRQIRVEAGASLRDVAREIGVSATSVIRWERGASWMSGTCGRGATNTVRGCGVAVYR